MWINILLVVFNLIPAFPMDGGRVLRALLATRMDYARATQVAAGVGQALAVVFGFIGLFNNFFLVFIAIFVYLGAEAESQMVTLRSTFRNVPVREAMMTRFRTLFADDPLESAITELLAGAQHDFPVMADGHVVGLLPRDNLLKSLAQGQREGRVADVMQQPIPIVEDDAPLDRVFEKMREAGVQSLPVVRDGSVVGVLTLENIGEWAMIQSALRNVKMPGGFNALARA
jgi:CBS domain-containing protein